MSDKITRKEYIFLGLVSFFIIVITTAPFVYGYFITSPDKFFLGFHALAPGDYMVYRSYISQAAEGHVLFQDIFTHESEAHNMLNIFWIFPGMLVRFLGLTPYIAFHVIRNLSIPILLGAAYLLISLFFQSVGKRRFALLLVAFSTGVSGYVVPLLEKISYNIDGSYYHKPMDLWVAESNAFLSMMHSGHMALALALIILIFYLTLLFAQKQKYSLSILAGFCSLLLFSFSPFYVPVIFGVLIGAYIVYCFQLRLIHKKMFFHNLIIAVFSTPVLLYYFFILQKDTVMIIRAAQNLNFTPAWYFLFLSFGALIPCAIGGFVSYVKNGKARQFSVLFLLTWIIIQLFLLYSPFHFQRRMAGGLQIPLALLSTAGLFSLRQFLQTKLPSRAFQYVVDNKLVLFFVFLFVFGFSNVFLLFNDFILYSQQTAYTHWPQADKKAIEWIADNTAKPSVIFSHHSTGNLIAGLAQRKVYAAHQVETLYFGQKVELTKSFFKNNGVDSDEKKEIFLQKIGITHLYYGQQEKTLGDFAPDTKSYLRLVYENEGVKIYRVEPISKIIFEVDPEDAGSLGQFQLRSSTSKFNFEVTPHRLCLKAYDKSPHLPTGYCPSTTL